MHAALLHSLTGPDDGLAVRQMFTTQASAGLLSFATLSRVSDEYDEPFTLRRAQCEVQVLRHDVTSSLGGLCAGQQA